MTAPLRNHPRLTEVTQEVLDPQRKRFLPIPLRLIVALALLIGIGTLLLRLPWMTTQPISWLDALFTATSAAAVTGLTVVTTSTAFTRPGQWVILLLMQFGGLGLLVTTVLTLRLLGRQISLVDRLAVSTSLGLASPRAILQVLGRTVTLMLAVEGIGALILWDALAHERHRAGGRRRLLRPLPRGGGLLQRRLRSLRRTAALSRRACRPTRSRS
jgi:Trk-type K+ transport system membrane component